MLVNFHQVDSGLFRSGRPAPADFAAVKIQFKTVLSLEGLEEDIKEQSALFPVNVLSFPIVFPEIYFLGITQKELKNILDAIELAEKPCLIHCQHGRDRTGLIVAAYRVRHGWTKAVAQAEMRALGYRWWLNFGLNRTWRKV